MANATEARKSPLEYLLSIITDVRAGEGISAVLLALNIFLLLTAYYLIKPVREALILVLENGAQYKSYMNSVIAITLLIAVPLYSRAAQRFARNRLVIGVTLFFVSHLLLFYGLRTVPVVASRLGLIFYLWVGIFNMMVVAQFWAFANDLYSEEQGKRLFPLVGVGASMGALLGSGIAAVLIEPLGVYQMLVVAASLLVLCAGLTQVVHRRESKATTTEDARQDEASGAVSEPEPSDESETDDDDRKAGAFQLVFRHRYLTLIALFSLTFTLVNTNGEYILGSLIKADAFESAQAEIGDAQVTEFLAGDGAEARVRAKFDEDPSAFDGRSFDEAKRDVARKMVVGARAGSLIGSAFGNFFSFVNLLSLALQIFLVSRLVKYLGLGRAFFILPVIALLDATAIAVMPLLMIVWVGKTVENATDYSLNNTLRNMLWLPTTRAMKYRAKQAVDSFFVRMGDAAHGLVIFIVAELLALGLQTVAIINVVLCMFWLYLAGSIVVENRRMVARAEASKEA